MADSGFPILVYDGRGSGYAGMDQPKPRSAQQARHKKLRFAYYAASASIISSRGNPPQSRGVIPVTYPTAIGIAEA